MIIIEDFIADFPEWLNPNKLNPWEVLQNLEVILAQQSQELTSDYIIMNGIAIHQSAVIEKGVTFKGVIIISENCFVGANAYLRGSIYLGNSVSIGPGCEIKQSVICNHSRVAHFNFIGDSIIGSSVNFEAGAVCANHFNEKMKKTITVLHQNDFINTGVEKFGALVGDDSKIGANSVLSPGTILPKNSIVKRLELIDQVS